jgi:hypothetical protein
MTEKEHFVWFPPPCLQVGEHPWGLAEAKYRRHPRRYDARSLVICIRLIPRVRRVMSRICTLNLARAFGCAARCHYLRCGE